MKADSQTVKSKGNPAIKRLRLLTQKKYRDESGLFVAEGEDLIAEAAQSGFEPVELYSAAGSGLEGIPVDPEVLASVSSLGSGTRTIGVFKQRLEQPLGPLCVYLHAVSDPGNIGTILRSALAFGASCVALGPDCADPFGPKAVRASMGAIFRVPLTKTSLSELPGEKLALVAGQGQNIATVSVEQATVVVGAERSGLPDAVVSQCDRVLQIPIAFESLNVAMATTVALYELIRNKALGSDLKDA